jgi:cardiolipin synthase A/B
MMKWEIRERIQVNTMRSTVRIVLFIFLLGGVYYFLNEKLDNGFLSYVSILTTLSVIFISFVIFLENRHPSQTLTWLVVLGGFPVVGFIFYLLFGRSYRKEKMFRKKYFLDKQAFVKIEGDAQRLTETRMQEMEEDHRRLFTLAQKLGNSPISFATSTKVLTNGEETFTHILQNLKQAKHLNPKSQAGREG